MNTQDEVSNVLTVINNKKQVYYVNYPNGDQLYCDIWSHSITVYNYTDILLYYNFNEQSFTTNITLHQIQFAPFIIQLLYHLNIIYGIK